MVSSWRRNNRSQRAALCVIEYWNKNTDHFWSRFSLKVKYMILNINIAANNYMPCKGAFIPNPAKLKLEVWKEVVSVRFSWTVVQFVSSVKTVWTGRMSRGRRWGEETSFLYWNMYDNIITRTTHKIQMEALSRCFQRGVERESGYERTEEQRHLKIKSLSIHFPPFISSRTQWRTPMSDTRRSILGAAARVGGSCYLKFAGVIVMWQQTDRSKCLFEKKWKYLKRTASFHSLI